MNKEEAVDILKNCIADYVIGDFCVGKFCPMEKECKDKECVFEQAIDIVSNYIEKLENMYNKEHNEHIEMKRQNGVLRNNERILREKIEELEKENEQLKVNEEILMKTKGCLDKDGSTDCRVLESLSYGIRAYEKTLRNSVHKDKIRELKEKIHNDLDNNGITRAYQIKIDEYFEELLKEGK